MNNSCISFKKLVILLNGTELIRVPMMEGYRRHHNIIYALIGIHITRRTAAVVI